MNGEPEGDGMGIRLAIAGGAWGVLCGVAVALRLAGVVSWPWWVVLALLPFAVPGVVALGIGGMLWLRR